MKRGPYKKQDVLERFMSKVEIADDCWNWIARLNENGYPTFNPTYGVKRYAHRWIYETVVEPIPDGLTIDHICSNPPCVNPDHLEVVTLGENSRRAGQRRPLCGNGHEWSEENTYYRKDNGKRQCRACALDRWHAKNPDRPRLKHKSTILEEGCPGDPHHPANQPISQDAPFGAVIQQEALI